MDGVDMSGHLLSFPGVIGLVEFGSSARGASRPNSDLDVLVVVDRDAHRKTVRAHLDMLLRGDWGHVSATVLTIDDLSRMVTRAPSFGAHLHDEGRLHGLKSHQRAIREALRAAPFDADALREEVMDLRRHLDRLSNERTLAGHYDTAAGRLFSIARAAAILDGMARGSRVYDWQTVFESLATRDPSLRPATRTALSLRPYFEALDGRRSPPPPASHRLYASALKAAASILDSVPRSPQPA